MKDTGLTGEGYRSLPTEYEPATGGEGGEVPGFQRESKEIRKTGGRRQDEGCRTLR